MNVCNLPSHLILHGPPMPPKMAARRLSDGAIKGKYQPEALHTYTDATEHTTYWRIRARLPNGEKWVRPMRVHGMVYELKEPDFPDGRKPLYRLHELANGDKAEPVLFVEGEKCADAVAKLGLIATTSGSAASDDKSDFEPLRGRPVILWPDNDQPGRDHVARVAAKLRTLSCVVEVIDLDALTLPEHGDVVDWFAAHPAATAADLMALARLPADEQAATGGDDDNFDEAIKRLAAMPRIQYEREREAASKHLSIRASVLDRLVKEARSQDSGQGSRVLFDEVELSAVAVPLDDLLTDISAIYSQHVVLPPHAAEAAALWSVMTWATDHTDCAPILLLKSPEPRCGKSTLLGLLNMLCRRPLPVANVSPAALFRVIEQSAPTLLIDEGDSFLARNEELRGVINAGHTRSTAFVLRTVGDDFEPRRFAVFGPKALALIGKAPHTITDRSIVIELRRKLPSERVTKLRDAPKARIHALRAALARWALDDAHRIADARPSSCVAKAVRSGRHSTMTRPASRVIGCRRPVSSSSISWTNPPVTPP